MGTTSPTLLASGAIQLIGAAAFSFAGRTVRHELRRTASHGAATAFVVWWAGVASYLALEGAFTTLAYFGFTALAPWVLARYLGLFLIGAALWGITYYVSYVWLGREGLRVPLAFVFAALPAIFVAYQVSHHALRVTPRAWLVAIEFLEPVEGPVYNAILAGFAFPPIAAAVGYLSLWSRAHRREQRWRIALVGTSIILYLGSGLVVRMGTNDFLKFLNLTFVGLGMSIAVVMAYRPPAAVRAWLAGEPRSERASSREERRAELSRRCRELV